MYKIDLILDSLYLILINFTLAEIRLFKKHIFFYIYIFKLLLFLEYYIEL